MRSENGSFRAAVLATAAVVGGLGSLVGLASAGPAPHAAAAPAKVALLTISQRNMARLGYLRVRVRGNDDVAARLFAMGRQGKAGARRLTRSRLVRVRDNRSKVVKLALTAFGRRAVAGCDPLRISANGRARAKGKRRSRRLKSSVRPGVRDPGRCTPKKGGASAGGESPAAGGVKPLGAID